MAAAALRPRSGGGARRRARGLARPAGSGRGVDRACGLHGARAQRTTLITADEILERLGDPSLALVDARPGTGFRGEALGLDPVAGHIPGARERPDLARRDRPARARSTRTRSSRTAAPASPPARRCSPCIAPAARTRACTRARGASGRARACLLRRRERDEGAPRRQLRLVHLQPRPPARGARRRGGRAAKRRGGRSRLRPSSRPPTSSSLPGRDAPRARGRPSTSSAAWRRRRPLLAFVWAIRRSSRHSAARSLRRSGSSTGRRRRSNMTAAASSPGCRRASAPAATTRWPRRAFRTTSRSRHAPKTGEVMGVRHRTLQVDGVQFHPESVLTLPLGRDLLRNFLEAA